MSAKRRSDSINAPRSFTFYIDECLGKLVAEELVRAGYHVVTWLDLNHGGVPDSVWLPDICERGFLLLTKDKAQRTTEVERKEIIRCNGRAFMFTNAQRTGPENAALAVRHAKRMLDLASSRKAPFIAKVGDKVKIIDKPPRPKDKGPKRK